MNDCDGKKEKKEKEPGTDFRIEDDCLGTASRAPFGTLKGTLTSPLLLQQLQNCTCLPQEFLTEIGLEVALFDQPVDLDDEKLDAVDCDPLSVVELQKPQRDLELRDEAAAPARDGKLLETPSPSATIRR